MYHFAVITLLLPLHHCIKRTQNKWRAAAKEIDRCYQEDLKTWRELRQETDYLQQHIQRRDIVVTLTHTVTIKSPTDGMERSKAVSTLLLLKLPKTATIPYCTFYSRRFRARWL